MNEPEQDSVEPALLGALRADFAPVARAPRERIPAPVEQRRHAHAQSWVSERAGLGQR